ncbi:MAG: class I SAM-dependent methyltransferase [Sphingobacteriales bacterium]|nr:class I SAM-dependent methyltransferase [Sphingobacteriales bacterium]OJY90280.1 MAG: SAM-dependent methyltransferase [Sphingobacteriales bacterium 44-15]
MYNTFELAARYFRYYITAANGRGHGIHSPFVYRFITGVLNDNRIFYPYSRIEALRQEMLTSAAVVEVDDFGAGSSGLNGKTRKIKDIARRSLKSPKYARLLFRIANYYQPGNILELGTSLGITTSYLASANSHAKVYTLEGAPAVAGIAKANFRKLGLSNISTITGNFDDTLAPVLQQTGTVDLVFIDGNHRKAPTLKYVEQLKAYTGERSIVILDDIHWSGEMEDAWAAVRLDPSVTCSIDLFFIGILFYTPDFKTKQHFVIRY